MAQSRVRATVRKIDGHWVVTILNQGRVVAHGADGWSTWDAAMDCAVRAVTARRARTIWLSAG
jgi:hypothetical protein